MREREREREREGKKERKKERKRERKRERDRVCVCVRRAVGQRGKEVEDTTVHNRSVGTSSLARILFVCFARFGEIKRSSPGNAGPTS